MPKVDFYNLPTPKMADCLLFCCKLINKVWQQVDHIYVHCQDTHQRQQLNELLWQFNPTSFIAHDLVEENQESPVLLGYEEQDIPVTSTALLINLSFNIPKFYQQFERVTEFVIDDPLLKEKARDNYRFYQTAHCLIDYHNLSKI